jgi:Gnt-I system low-affinity gluconate transporter
MLEDSILLVVLIGIALLLIQVLYFKIPAFVALLIASIATGILGGMSGVAVMQSVEKGMGSTLGFVATVVGLGAIFGGILEKSGGAMAISKGLMKSFGERNASSAMLVTGFILAIPVFFDVAFIILVPVIYALQKSSGKSLLHFGLPLLAGLAIAHTFIPPTPGPVAVANMIDAELGWVIAIGFLGGIPAAILGGLVYGKFISKKIFIPAPLDAEPENDENLELPSFRLILVVMSVPMLLIICGSIVKSELINIPYDGLKSFLLLLGHPFSALIIANLIVWYALGIKKGFTASMLSDISAKSFKPTGLIILCTGAGGVFKQVLMDTGAGNEIAKQLSESGLPVVVFAFLATAIVRMAQGSATVAMITAAGLVAPILTLSSYSQPQLAIIVLSIASGASVMSHFNDSGFWMVKQYLGMTEKQTLQTWSVLTTIIALTGFVSAVLLFMIF